MHMHTPFFDVQLDVPQDRPAEIHPEWAIDTTMAIDSSSWPFNRFPPSSVPRLWFRMPGREPMTYSYVWLPGFFPATVAFQRKWRYKKFRERMQSKLRSRTRCAMATAFYRKNWPKEVLRHLASMI